MEKTDRLTPKQEAFCRAYAVEGKSQRQAYISAYGRGKRNDAALDVDASRLLKNPKVLLRCKELKSELCEKVVWEKADMIRDLKRIADECRDAAVKVTTNGKTTVQSLDTKARSVAVNAIKTASEILGYKAAEKVNLSANEETKINITFGNKSKRKTGEIETDPFIVDGTALKNYTEN